MFTKLILFTALSLAAAFRPWLPAVAAPRFTVRDGACTALPPPVSTEDALRAMVLSVDATRQYTLDREGHVALSTNDGTQACARYSAVWTIGAASHITITEVVNAFPSVEQADEVWSTIALHGPSGETMDTGDRNVSVNGGVATLGGVDYALYAMLFRTGPVVVFIGSTSPPLLAGQTGWDILWEMATGLNRNLNAVIGADGMGWADVRLHRGEPRSTGHVRPDSSPDARGAVVLRSALASANSWCGPHVSLAVGSAR